MPLARDLGLIKSPGQTGERNSITDVPGVLVGHQTIRRDNLHTGVTAVLPHSGNLFREKVPAAVHVINGFGKSVGLMQIEELGQIESPLLLTNTLSVGTCATALIRDAIKQNPEIGRTTSTINPVVCECNDGWLSDIQALAVNETDALEAIKNACDVTVVQGSVGAGTGMRCFGFKGGIGSSSRTVRLDDSRYHVGILTLTNFGKPGSLVLPDGRRPHPRSQEAAERGSVIIIMATDVPLDTRQLHRVIKRCGAGLAQLGSTWGHGSGDVVVGFTTAWRIQHEDPRDLIPVKQLNENRIDQLFEAAAEATVEAVLNSMLASPATHGRNGNFAPSLADAINS